MSIWLLKPVILAWIANGLAIIPAVMASVDLEGSVPRWIDSTAYFENANACMWAGVDKEVCQSAHRSAYRQHVRKAPAYRDQAACESAFAVGECFASGDSGLWTPWFSGFALLTHTRLPPSLFSEHQASSEQATQANKSWWQYLHGNGQPQQSAIDVRYFSEPLYWERDRQGGVRLTTLREKSRTGEGLVNSVGKRQQARGYEPQRLIDVPRRDDG
jgi:uncharacterized protein YgiB involved in biofilm formation